MCLSAKSGAIRVINGPYGVYIIEQGYTKGVGGLDTKKIESLALSLM